MRAKARYSLKEVFGLISEGKYWFSAEPRSLLAVVEVYEKAGFPKTLTEASFHPPEKDLKTASGIVIPGTGRPHGKGTEKK